MGLGELLEHNPFMKINPARLLEKSVPAKLIEKTPPGKLARKSPIGKLILGAEKEAKHVPNEIAEMAGVSSQRNMVSAERMARSRGVNDAIYGKAKWEGLAGVEKKKMDEVVRAATSRSRAGGSSAGLRNESSALIQYNGTGYSNPAMAHSPAIPTPLTPTYNLGMRTGGASSYTDLRMRGGGSAQKLSQYTRTY